MAATVAGALVTGTIASTAITGTPFQPVANKPFNAFLSGTWTGTLTLSRSYDQGTTWLSVPLPSLSGAAAFTANTNLVVSEPESGVTYAWISSGTWTGTAAYRFSC